MPSAAVWARVLLMRTASVVRPFRAPCSNGPVRIQGAMAGLALTALLGALALPLLEVALANESAPLCCSRGRCCCAGVTAGSDERPCLRRGCGCERPDATVAGGPLGLEAVLPASLPAHLESHTRRGAIGRVSVLSRPHAPPVPPPRRVLPA